MNITKLPIFTLQQISKEYTDPINGRYAITFIFALLDIIIDKCAYCQTIASDNACLAKE